MYNYKGESMWSSNTGNVWGASQFVINEEPAVFIRDEIGTRVWNWKPSGDIYKNIL